MSSRVGKILKNVIKKHNYDSHCVPTVNVNIHTFYRVKEDAKWADYIIFDKNYEKFNSILTRPYYDGYSDISLYNHYKVYRTEPYLRSDFKYLVLYPDNEKYETLIVIPSLCLIDMKNTDQTLIENFKYNKYIDRSPIFMKEMLTCF